MAGQRTCGSGSVACIAADQARAYAAGELGSAERASIDRRIAACPRCRAAVEAALGRACDPVGATAVAPAVADTVQARGPSAPPASRSPAATASGPGEAALAPGEIVGRYVVERPLGAGGMGLVSLARDPELHRAVVIKLVHPGISLGSIDDGDDFEARLRREAQAMAQLSHPNVVQIFDIGRRGDRLFLAMEFVDGHTLDGWLRERPRTGDEILGAIRQAGAGLAAAHRAGLVHRDVKPSNVLVGRDGVVKVTDFGLARAAGGRVSGDGDGPGPGATRQLRQVGAAQRPPRPSGVHAVLTQADAVVGTPAYMAPEQAAGAALDARTDQYALAVTLLDALTGQRPTRRTADPAEPAAVEVALVRAGVRPGIRAAIVRALSREPSARFASIDELLAILSPPPPPSARPRSRRAILAIAGIALCGGAAIAWRVASPAREPDCAAAAPGQWTASARASVVASLSAPPAGRPFAGWEAERVAVAIDRAVESLAAGEVARCRGTPPAAGPATASSAEPGAASGAGPGSGSPSSGDCFDRRSAALTAGIAALSASPPPEDPWPAVHAIERCDPPRAAEVADLRGKLRGATAAQAAEIAHAAESAGDELLAADAYEAAAVAALSAGELRAAGDSLRAMNAAGVQADSAAASGRALLHLIELARASGDHELARQQLVALDALLRRHGDPPRDVIAAALAEAPAFADLGDVATAFAAWDRAAAAAQATGDRDAQLAAAIGRAWSTYQLRLDLAGAKTAASAALAAGAEATPAARAAVLGVAADLAIADGDAAAAQAALAEAARLVPGATERGDGRVRALRTRALSGDVDAAVAELARGTPGDPAASARAAIARGEILYAADHASEAGDVLDRVAAELRYAQRAILPLPERIAAELAACDAHIAATGSCKAAVAIDALVKQLDPHAPVRARLARLQAASAPSDARSYKAQRLTSALDILVDTGAAPLAIAELRWQLAQLCALGTDCKKLASQAREVFTAAGHADDVAAIDRWLAELTGAAPDAGPSGGSGTGAPP